MAETNKVHYIDGPRALEDPRRVFENIRRLRDGLSDRSEFLETFLSSVSVLCNAPVVAYCSKNVSGWIIERQYRSPEPEETEEGPSEDLPETCVRLLDRALLNDFAYERCAGSDFPLRDPVALVTRLETADADGQSALLLVFEKGTPQQLNDIIVRTRLISDVTPARRDRTVQAADAIGKPPDFYINSVFNIIDAAFHKDRFGLCAMTLVNEIANRFDCSRASLGWNERRHVNTAAVSHVEKFDTSGETIQRLESLFEESRDQDSVVASPPLGDEGAINRAHREYAAENGLTHAVTMPVRLGGEVIAVLTMERQNGLFSSREIDAATLALDLAAHWLDVLHREDLWIGGRVAHEIRKRLKSWFGLEHSLFNATVVLLVCAFAYSLVGTWPYRIEGAAVLKTDSVSYISAPFDGVVADMVPREGDEITKGDLLITFDEKELSLKETEIEAEIARYRREADKHRAGGALADMRIAAAMAEESRIELEKVRHYLSRARVTAPESGVVVEGDKQKLVGSPVSRGDVLVKIARIESMYARIKIGEQDVSEKLAEAKGRLRLIGSPGHVFEITVENLIPMSEVDPREGNVFVLNARIDSPPEPWWKPGMSGVAKIDAGERKIFWILTHRIADFLRLHLWW